MEARRMRLSAALLWAVCFVPRWPRSSLFPRCLHCCMERGSPAATRRVRKRRIPMPEIKHERKSVSWWVVLPGLVLAVALGLFIYSGIHGRVEAESNLQHATEQASIEDVS